MSEFDWQKVNWTELYLRLLLWAVGRWGNHSVPEVEGIVHEAIVKTWLGDRAYERSKHFDCRIPDGGLPLYYFLQGVVRNLVFNTRRHIRVVGEHNERYPVYEADNAFSEHVDQMIDLDVFEKTIQTEPDLLKLFNLLKRIEGSNAREKAALLGVPVSTYNNLLKKLKRRIENFLD